MYKFHFKWFTKPKKTLIKYLYDLSPKPFTKSKGKELLNYCIIVSSKHSSTKKRGYILNKNNSLNLANWTKYPPIPSSIFPQMIYFCFHSFKGIYFFLSVSVLESEIFVQSLRVILLEWPMSFLLIIKINFVPKTQL